MFSKTVTQLAMELALPVPRVIAQIKRMGVKPVKPTTVLTAPLAEQVLRFVRSMEASGSSSRGSSSRGSKRRPIAVVVRQHGPTLLAMPFITGVAVSADPEGHPFVRVFARKTRDALPGLPKRIDGYPVLVEQIGEVTAE